MERLVLLELTVHQVQMAHLELMELLELTVHQEQTEQTEPQVHLEQTEPQVHLEQTEPQALLELTEPQVHLELTVLLACVRVALPKVTESLSPGAGRVTNVEPLPRAVLEAIYSRPEEEDEAGVQQLMAAQAIGGAD